MGAIEIELDPLPCRWCQKLIKQPRWWRPKRHCSRWHRVKSRLTEALASVLELL
ncbi:hypothetical protein [Streptomyces sp. QHH-9511]|uniref:hypothetical protein n=1 Tax=Streptomyces sp. QHH-9511 TaxID=2684468 RepID=UPI0018E09E44|nr:hypothetical protein [Streptomyces sp. QHH-9511]